MSSPGLCKVCGGVIIRRVENPVSLPVWNKLTLDKTAANSAKLCNCQPASTTAVSTNPNHQIKILQNIRLCQPQFDNVSDGEASESEVIELSSDDSSTEAVVPAELNSRPAEVGKGQSSSVLRRILIGNSFNRDKYRNKNYFGGAGPSRNVVDVPAVSVAGVSSAAEDTAAPVMKKARRSGQNLRDYFLNFNANVTQNSLSQISIPSFASFDVQPVLDDIYQKYDGDVGFGVAVADIEFYNVPTPQRQLGDVVVGAAVIESPAPTAASVARSPDLFDLLNDDVNDVVTNAAVVASPIPAASVATSQNPRSPDLFENSDDEFIIQAPTNFADVLRSQPMDGADEAPNMDRGPEDAANNSLNVAPAQAIGGAVAPPADWEDDDFQNMVVRIEAKKERFERLVRKLKSEYNANVGRNLYLSRQILNLLSRPRHAVAEVRRLQNELSACTRYCEKLLRDIEEKQGVISELPRF